MMLNLKLPIIFVVLLFATSSAGFAASGHWDEHAAKTFIFQLFNVFVLLGLFLAFLWNPMKAYFSKRYEDFCEKAEQSQSELKAAQKALEDIQNKLIKVKETWDQTLVQAQAEAAEQKKKQLEEARVRYQIMLKETEKNLVAEQNRLKAQLQSELVSAVAEAVEKKIRGSVTQDQHRHLQAQMQKNIEEAQI